MVNIVKNAIKDAEYTKQDKDEVQKEIFKPITGELKNEIDEISDLREEYVKSANRPITYNPQQALTDETKQILDLDSGITDYDKTVFQKYQLQTPKIVWAKARYDDDIIQDVLEQTINIKRKTGLEKARLSTAKKKKKKKG